MKDAYLEEYGVDPEPLLLTDWMSDLVSELEDGDDDEKYTHRMRVLEAAGFSMVADTSKC